MADERRAMTRAGTGAEQRRRMVYTGLSQVLSGDSLIRALCLWYRHYRDEPVYAVREYLSLLGTELGLVDERPRLQHALVNATFVGESELLDDPLALIRAHCFEGRPLPESLEPSPAARSKTAPLAPEGAGGPEPAKRTQGVVIDVVEPERGRSFGLLMARLLARMDRMRPGLGGLAKQRLIGSAEEWPLTKAQLARLQAWLLRAEQPTAVHLRLEYQRDLIHYTYLIALDELGPNEADHLLAKATDDVDDSGVGGGFSARRFL